MWHIWETGEVCAGFWWGKPRERDNLEDVCVDGRIILKCMFKKWDGVMNWIDLVEDIDRWRALVNVVVNLWVL